MSSERPPKSQRSAEAQGVGHRSKAGSDLLDTVRYPRKTFSQNLVFYKLEGLKFRHSGARRNNLEIWSLQAAVNYAPGEASQKVHRKYTARLLYTLEREMPCSANDVTVSCCSESCLSFCQPTATASLLIMHDTSTFVRVSSVYSCHC